MTMPDSELIIASDSENGQRLDKVLANRYSPDYSRAYFQWLIENRYVQVNSQAIKKRMRLEMGDKIEIQFVPTPEIELLPEDIPLDIIYEDESIIVINKRAGMVVHPGSGNWSGTFVNALLFHCQDLPESRDLRPGIVHRLDKGTTGVLVAAKTTSSHQKLIELFSSRKVYKQYLAVCLGNPGCGTVNAPIGRHPANRQKMAVREEGRKAITHYETQVYNATLSKVKVILESGRTHQIRVHMKHIGSPVLGDPVYGSASINQKYHLERQMLHAEILKFPHPFSGDEMLFQAPIPSDMDHILKQFPEILNRF